MVLTNVTIPPGVAVPHRTQEFFICGAPCAIKGNIVDGVS
jgi:hypothetical protein